MMVRDLRGDTRLGWVVSHGSFGEREKAKRKRLRERIEREEVSSRRKA